MTKIDNINTFGTAEEALVELERRERASGILGCGEVIDEGELSRDECARIYPIIKDEDIEAEIDRILAEEWDGESGFVALGMRRPSRDEIRASIQRDNKRHQELIDAAPAETIHAWTVYA